MRQKYVVSRDGPNNNLIIEEYAITDTKVKKPASPTLHEGKFTLLCKETYEGKIIFNSISNGIKSLVPILRTHNLFPIEPHAFVIAEAVVALYESTENTPIELFFDDVDLCADDMETA